MINQLHKQFLDLQQSLIGIFSDIDDTGFIEYPRQSPKHCSHVAVIEGSLIEKGAINVSYLNSNKMPSAASKRHPECADKPFEVTGISMIIHPHNPHAPTMHANLRAFSGGPDGQVQWIGGGMDLTPAYGYSDDAIHWHQTIKKHCDDFDTALYSKFKQQCDDYFYLPHRKEWRGVGGIFFDDLNWPAARSFDFLSAMGECITKAYLPILQRRL